MGKLFGKGDSRAVSTESIGDIGLDEIRARQLITSADINPEILEELEDSAQGLSDATDTTEMAMEHLHVLESIKDGLTNNTLLSDRYLITLENFKPLAGRLGLKSLPAMEDFKNKYAAESAHTFALEGIGDVIRKFWEKIKDFFRSFFKRVMVFFKKLLKANLDLESYEKYTDQLIAKLNTNKAVIGDNSPLYSKLPSYIANRNETKIDSTYILNVGMPKIKALLKSINDMKISHGATSMNPSLVKDMVKDYTQFYNQNKSGITNVDDLKASVDLLILKGMGLLAAGFNFQVPDQKSLPEEVFVALNEKLNGNQFRSEQIKIYSMSDMFSDFNSLPRETNVFIALMYDTGGEYPKDFFVRGSAQDLSYVDGKVNPINNLQALTSLYKEYKNGIAKIDLKGFSKGVDDTADEIEKLVTMVSKTIPELNEMVRIKAKASSSTPNKLGDLLHTLYVISKSWDHAKRSNMTNDMNITTSKLKDQLEQTVEHEEGDVSTDLIEKITDIFSFNKDKTPEDFSVFNSANKEFQRVLVDGLLAMPFVNEMLTSGGSDDSRRDADLCTQELKRLNDMLSKTLLNLQLIYRELGTLYYQQVTEIRYALIKYIYDSASRYTY